MQISCDISTRFACYLYFTKQCWTIKMVIVMIVNTITIFIITITDYGYKLMICVSAVA